MLKYIVCCPDNEHYCDIRTGKKINGNNVHDVYKEHCNKKRKIANEIDIQGSKNCYKVTIDKYHTYNVKYNGEFFEIPSSCEYDVYFIIQNILLYDYELLKNISNRNFKDSNFKELHSDDLILIDNKNNNDNELKIKKFHGISEKYRTLYNLKSISEENEKIKNDTEEDKSEDDKKIKEDKSEDYKKIRDNTEEENEKIKNDTEEENKQINPIKKIKKRKQSSIKKVFNTKLEPNTKSSANLATQLNKFMSSSYDTSDDETDIDVEKKTFDVILNSDSDLSSTEYIKKLQKAMTFRNYAVMQYKNTRPDDIKKTINIDL